MYMYMSFARCQFRALKSRFSGTNPLQVAMALEMDLSTIKGRGGGGGAQNLIYLIFTN